jgi:4-aminobutyrate aminotransferase
MRHLRKICDQHGIMLIVDEVQSGFGRTGTMFAMEAVEGFKADAIVFAKGFANGYPISGLVSSKKFMDKLDPGSMGGTYAGNAVACAAASAVADVFKNEDILGNVRARYVCSTPSGITLTRQWRTAARRTEEAC